MARSQSKAIVLITLTVILSVAITGWWWSTRQTPQSQPVKIDRQQQPILGNPKARIHLVVFEDLKCTNCKIYHNTLFPQIKQAFLDTGKANYTFINLAFIPGSMPAANAARCLYAQHKQYFFPFVDYVFQHQPDETEDWATPSTLLQFAKAAVPQANLEQLSACIVEARYNNVMMQNLKIATEAMQGQVATPALFVNGRQVNTLNLKEVARLAKLAHRED